MNNFMQKIFIIPLFLLIITGCGNNDKISNDELSKCTYDMEGQYEIFKNFENNAINSPFNYETSNYCLIDIDNDNQKELLVDRNTHINVFKIVDGEIYNYGQTTIESIELRSYKGDLTGTNQKNVEMNGNLYEKNKILYIYKVGQYQGKEIIITHSGILGEGSYEKYLKKSTRLIFSEEYRNSKKDKNNQEEVKTDKYKYFDSNSKLILNEIYYDMSETDFENNRKTFTFENDFGDQTTTAGLVSYIKFLDNNKVNAVTNRCSYFEPEELEYKHYYENGNEYVELTGSFISESIIIEIVSEKELKIISGKFDCGEVNGFKLYEQ